MKLINTLFFVSIIFSLSSCTVEKHQFLNTRIPDSSFFKKQSSVLTSELAPATHEDSAGTFVKTDSISEIQKIVSHKVSSSLGPLKQLVSGETTSEGILEVVAPKKFSSRAAIESPDEESDSALYVGIMALIGAICGFLIVSNPGGWIYFGIILFVCAPIMAIIAIISGIVVLDKTKDAPKDFIPGRRMAKIGIALGLIAGAMLLAFFNANPDFFG